MNDDVGTQSERLLEVRRGKGIVHHEARAVLVSDVRHLPDIDDLEQRVGGSLDPEHPGGGPDGRLDGSRIAHVDVVELEAVPRQNVGEKTIRPAVQIVTGDHVVPGVQQVHDGRLGGHAGGEGEAEVALLQGGDDLFHHAPRRVAGAGILVSSVLSNSFLGIGRGLVDGRNNGARPRLRLLRDVDGTRGEPPAVAGVGLIGHISLRTIISQPARAAGTARWAARSRRSAAIASNDTAIAPTWTSEVEAKLLLMPSKSRAPRPPASSSAATLAMAMVATVATRSPATITGSASGYSMRKRI